ncbi:MAG: right-handed parallel beta-helix repeat-containing protein [Bacteroidota bacterium]
MKRHLTIILFLIVILITNSAWAQTNVSGTIDGDSTTVWTLAGSPYIVTNSIRVTSLDTLIIEKDVEVRFNGNYTIRADFGVVRADTVTFTSNLGSPGRGSYGGLEVTQGLLEINGGSIQYAGSSTNRSAAVYNTRGTAILRNVSITDANRGVHIENPTALTTNSQTTLEDVTISNTGIPVVVAAKSDVFFNGNNLLTGNDQDIISMTFSELTDRMVLRKAPVPFYFSSSFFLSDTLEIESDNILKIGNQFDVTSNGYLQAVADPGEQIFFTSLRDDNLGEDSNADGTATGPASRNWQGIEFLAGSDGILQRVSVRHAGLGNRGAVTFNSVDASVLDSEFLNNYIAFYLNGSSAPAIERNNIGVSDLVPVAMQLSADPQFADNVYSFSDNEYDALGILTTSLTADETLEVRNFTGINNITYVMLGNLTIENGATLTVEEGIVIKALQNQRIDVKGKIVAQGADTSNIVFTSWKDDSHGNPLDTNKDGNNTAPTNNDWGGINFFDESDDTSIMDYTNVDYSRFPINITDANPTISNSEFGNAESAIRIFRDADPTITNNLFFNTTSVPVRLSVSADPTFSGNSFNNVGLRALGLIQEDVAISGVIRKRDFGGFSNITYAQLGRIRILSTVDIEVEPGVVIKSQSDIIVEGGFRADGANGENIIFTSLRDDNVGNPMDTNGDGNATAPARGNWRTIHYRNTADEAFSRIDSVEFWFGSMGLVLSGANIPVTNTLITDMVDWGIGISETATPTLENVVIQNTSRDPIIMSLLANPVFSNITFNSTATRGIAILEGTSTFTSGSASTYLPSNSKLNVSTTLNQRSLAGITNIAYIFNRIEVSPDATLSIEPGVVLKSQGGGFDIRGALKSVGTPTNPIVFTSLSDDSYGGDTNANGTNSVPSNRDWGDVFFQASNIDSVNAIKHTILRYGYGYGSLDRGIVTLLNSYVDMDSSVVELVGASGIAIRGSSDPDIQNTQFLNISSTPVRMAMFSNPTFSGNTALNVGIMALGILYEVISSDATVPKRDFAGFDNITYFVHGPSFFSLYSLFQINSGTTLTIPEGVVFKSSDGRPIFEVLGSLKVEGTDTAQVILTDWRDDDYGNPRDTQNDGPYNFPVSSNGTWVRFQDSSNDTASVVKNAILRYREFGVVTNSASPTVDSTLFNRINWGLDLTGVSNPVVTNNQFDSLRFTPFRTSLVSYPDTTFGNTISGSTYEAIGVRSETLVQDVTLPKRDFVGKIGIPYYLSGRYTVGTSATLTIDPGVVIKSNSSGRFIVQKGLIAEGGSTPDSVIVFTHIYDDFFSGDTNNDSSATTSGNFDANWGGILFEDEALDPLSRLDNVVLIGGTTSNSNGVAVETENASPTITNSVIRNSRIGVLARGSSNPVINDNDIYNNTQFGVRNQDETFNIDATNNWWGDDSGPTHSSNPMGTGDVVSNSVMFSPFKGMKAENPIIGDVSLNGEIQAFDASRILRHVVGAESFNSLQQKVGDASGTMGITAFDASLVLKFVVGSITYFPSELLHKSIDGEEPYQLHPSDAIVELGNGVEENGRVHVPIEVSNISQVSSFQLTLPFNAEAVAIEDVVKSEYLEQAQVTWNAEEGTLTIAVATAEVLNSDGTLATVTFEILDDSQSAGVYVSQALVNEVDVTRFSVSTEPGDLILPEEFSLLQNYPNPFNPTTNIQFALPEAAIVRLEVYNMLGQRVTELVNERMNAGSHTVEFDASALASGMYVYRITAGSYVSTKKMMLIK